jgi:hypothetical protein
MGILSLVGVLQAKTFATIYRVLWLTRLVRLFELKTCSEFNLKSYYMGILSLVGVLKVKTFAIIYRVLWLTVLVRLFELKTCSEFNLKSLLYWNLEFGGGFKGKNICHHLQGPVVDSFGTSF